MDSMESLRALPATYVPCFCPAIPPFMANRRLDTIYISNLDETKADPVVFAEVLRTLLATSGEFAFGIGKDKYVLVEGVDETEKDIEENVNIYDASQVTGVEHVHACMSSEVLEVGVNPLIINPRSDFSPAQQSIAFCLNIQPKGISLWYSVEHIPASFARALVELYLSKCGTDCHLSSLDAAETLSIVNHPVQSVLSNSKPLLHAACLEQAAMRPDQIAVDYLAATGVHPQRRTLSYGELDKYSFVVAKILRGMIPSGEKAVVPLALPPSPELYVGYLATLRAGYAFCPLPGCDAAPDERIRELVTDVGASVVLGMGPRPSWLLVLENVRWVDISLESDDSEVKCALVGDRQDWEDPDENDLAYVLFTSGSTGKPKGVQIPHLAAASSIASHLAVRPLPPYTRWFQFAVSTFDPSLMETFMNFSSGTTICAANRQRFLTDPESVLSELECTHMMATPSFAAMLNPERLGSPTSRSYLERGVKFELWTMGEKLSEKVIEAFSRPDEGFVLCNAYGPTEAAINTTLRVHPRHESGARLGPPIPSSTMVVLHPAEPRLVPQGFAGELGLAGPQLARGYLNMTKQTARAFVHIEGIGRVYRTGDKARVVQDENHQWTCIEYLGRIGLGQVKLSGRRVELGEIDAVMGSVPGVQSAHAVVRQQSSGGALQLFAFLTPNDEGLVAKVRKVVEGKLPRHMQPSRYFLGDVVPRSTAGKADRRAIAALVAGWVAQDVRSVDVKEEQAADEETLRRVLKLVAQTVDVDESSITPTSNLFDLGIDSLRGVRFLSLAREAQIQGITIMDLLQNSTPVELVNAIYSRQKEGESPEYHDTLRQFHSEAAPAVHRELGLSEDDPLPRILPATPMQAGVLALYLRGGQNSKGYINHSIYKLAPEIDLERFKVSWETIVQRHDILRSRFVLVDNSATSPFALVTLSDVSVTWTEGTGDDVDGLVRAYLEDIPARFSLQSLKAFALFKNVEGSDMRFVLSLHHSTFDGASLALMLEELSHLYNGSGASLRREGFEHSVKDALTANMEASTLYWKEQLKDFTPDGFPDLTGLRPSAKSAGHHVSTVTSLTAFSDLLKASRVAKSTPLAVLQAAWASVLVSYSESELADVVFGSIVGGRSSEELEYTVGPVFTAVPIRVRNAEEMSIGEVLSELSLKNVQGLVHRYPPVSVLSGPNGIIYDTTLAFQHFGQGRSQTELWTRSEYPAMETEFSVVLEVWPEENDSIRLRATCSNSVLIPSASEAMLRQFDDILKTILTAPTEAPFMDVVNGVRHELQSSINPIPQPFPVAPNTLIHHEFEENAKLCPDALAVWFKDDLDRPEKDVRYTYRQLEQKANRLAQFLISRYGNLVDQAIPLCMEKCPELYVAILGVLKAGAAWCPVDDAAPELRKRDLFARAEGPVVLIRNSAELPRIKAALPDDLDIVSLDDVRLDEQPDDAPVVETTPNQLAYLIWTSGTTGAPKGVPIEHKAAVQSLKVLQREIPHGDVVRCLNFSAYTFDVSVLDIFYALGSSCGTLCSSRKEILVGRFAEVVNAFEATQAFLTPAFMAQSSLSECKTLESLISIGEKLPDTVADRWCRPGTVSLNTYGPAESTIIATYRRFEPNEVTKAHNVGLPLQTVSCFAMHKGNIVPRGAVGELALGGYQNARGYHGQADMTAKKFIEHPVAGAVYMTGDIVRFLHDGTCEFVGRNDDLVKLGGIRVELSEISAALKPSHPAIHEAATMQVSRPDRPQKVVCTFLASLGASKDEAGNVCVGKEAIQIACAAKERAELSLPVFMHPNVIIVVKRLPHTASNKIDRKMLGEYYCDMDILSWERSLAEHLGAEGDEGEWSETERKIQNVVSELTGSPQDWVHRTTQLPALGIDSIRALQLSSRLRAVGINVSVQDILQNTTIKQLARKSDSFSSEISDVVSPWLEEFNARWLSTVQAGFSEKIERILPCTPLQEGMLGESIKNPGAYWSHRLLRLHKHVDLECLRNAWDQIIQRHEALRVVFLPAAAYSVSDSDSDSVFIQAILSQCQTPYMRYPIGKSDVRSLAEEVSRNIAVSRSKSHLPRWSLTFFEADEACYWMMLSMHHALYDAYTMSYLLQDVQREYYAYPATHRLQLSSSLARTFFVNNPAGSLRIWEDILTPFADRHSGAWPNLSDESSVSQTGFFSATFYSDRGALARISSQLGASVGHLLQAAWSIVSASYLKTDRVVFGETLSLRLESYVLQHAFAPLITTKPVVARVENHTTPRAIIEELAKLTKLSSKHRFIGFQHVRRLLQRPVNQPLFPSIFVVYFEEEDGISSLDEGESLWSSPVDVSSLGVEHPIAVNVRVAEGRVVVDVFGNSEIMSASHVELLARQFDAVLTAMISKLDEPVVSLFPHMDERYLSVIKGFPSKSQIHPLHWLEKFALARPEAVAVTSYRSLSNEVSCETWTYRALEEASNRVAHWIRQRCYGVTIGFCMPNTHTSIVYQLGIFKSGNTYLPIGAEIPAFRKRLIFRSGRASLVFTTKDLIPEFRSINKTALICVDDVQHLLEISECPTIKMSPSLPEVACIHFAEGHLNTSRASLVSSQNLVSMVEGFAEKIYENGSVRVEDIFLSWMPPSVDTHLLELFAPLRMGIKVACIPHQFLYEDVSAVFRRTEASHSFIQTAWLEHQGLRPCDLPSLGCAIFTGLPSRAALLKEWSNSKAVTVFRAFGFPGLFTLGPYHYDLPINIGSPLSCCTALVLREGSNTIALRGEIGELCATGGNLSQVYLRKRRDDSVDIVRFGSAKPMGILGRVRADDTIDYLGPRKSAEHDIDLAELSTSVQSTSHLSIEAATSVLDHPEGIQPYAVTFVSRSSSADPMDGSLPTIVTTDLAFTLALLDQCKRQLPSQLVPDFIIPLDFLPLSHLLSGLKHGARLKRAFQTSSLTALNPEGGKKRAAKSLTAVDEGIRTILSKAARVPLESIGAETTTLELGIDSLSAISLSYQLKAAGYFVPPHVILSGPSVAKLSQASRTIVERNENVRSSWEVDEDTLQLVRGQVKAKISSVLPCLPLQEGLVAHTLNSALPIYVNHFVLRLKEADPTLLRLAFDGMFEVNDILRTCFIAGDQSIVQVVLSEMPDIWRTVLVSSHDNPLPILRRDMGEIERDVVENMGQKPCIRLGLYISDSASYLCLTMHHAIYDGQSLSMLLTEVRDRYLGCFKIHRPPVSKLLNHLARQSQDSARAFFTEYLYNSPKTPTFSMNDGVNSHHHHTLNLDVPLSHLERISRSANISLHSLALAAFGVAVGEYRKRNDHIIGVVLSGRSVLIDDIDTMLAPCITTVPLRICSGGSHVFSDVAYRTHDAMTSVLEYQHTPLRLIQRWLGSSEALFDTLFTFNRISTGHSDSGDLWVSVESKAALDYPFALAIDADSTTDSAVIRAGHTINYGSVATVKAIMSRVAELLLDLRAPVDALPSAEISDSSPKFSKYNAHTWSREEILIRDNVAMICNVDKGMVTKDISFLHLGIDSITSIRLAQQLRAVGLAIPTFAIMRHPYIGELAEFLASNPMESTAVVAQRELLDIQEALRKEYIHSVPLLADGDEITALFPATPLQTGMLSQTISSRGRLYMVHHSFELDASISLERLRCAWETVISSTDILRCTFHVCLGGDYSWLAAVHSKAPLQWQEHAAPNASFLRLMAFQIENEAAIQDEDGFKKPPVSFHLINAPDTRVLIITMHHCLYDGLSLPYILEDVSAVYFGQELVRRPQFTDAVPFVLHSSKDETHFWQKRLYSFIPSPLPVLYPQEDHGNIHLAKQSVELSGNALDTIKEMGVTVQAVALLAWGKTLAAITGSLDVVFGQVVAGRAIELEDALLVSGPLFNTIPFRFTISDLSWSNIEGAQIQQASNVAAEPHSHAPLRRILADWRSETMSGDALFNTLFVFQQGNKNSRRSGLWTRFNISDEASASQYPLSVEIIHTETKIELRAGCQANIMAQAELEEVLRVLHDTLLDIVSHPTANILNQPPKLKDIRESPSRTTVVPLPENSSDAPRRELTGNERILRDAFFTVSKISKDKIRLETPLYALGLDSVGAIQVAALCRRNGFDIAVVDIFAGETISGICRAYENRRTPEAPPSPEATDLISLDVLDEALTLLDLKQGAQEVLPLLAGQLYHLGAWLACGGVSYEPVFAYRAAVQLDADRLHLAWNTLRARHSILRTAFAAVSSQDVVQVVLEEAPEDSSWTFTALEGEFEQRVRDQARIEYSRPSNLFKPPARARLVRVGDQDALLLVFHHAIYDAWSIPLLVRDLCALYEGLQCKSNSNFSSLVRHIHTTSIANKEAQVAFWQDTLESESGVIETSILPTVSPSSGLKQNFVRVPGVVSSVDALNNRCQDIVGVNLQALVIAVWGRVCQMLIGDDARDPILGVYHTGRAASYDGLAELAGPTVNVLPMRIPVAGGGSGGIWDVARKVQVDLGRRTAYEHCSLRDILGYVGHGHQDGPLFNVFVNLLWHGDKIRSMRKGSILESLPIGPPTDYAPAEPFELHSSIDAIDYSYLPKHGLYVDVVLDSSSQSLGIAIRCHEALLNKEKLHSVVDLFRSEVSNAFEILPS
ncbi:hypothetical protein GYMLUDRAFT_152778 [Collybiopsis luxurians FD-317 M1]|nr:hypothetical protein GYMLUDRAFT_152778 [Collybiopsis luxurians FD-317 M1]